LVAVGVEMTPSAWRPRGPERRYDSPLPFPLCLMAEALTRRSRPHTKLSKNWPRASGLRMKHGDHEEELARTPLSLGLEILKATCYYFVSTTTAPTSTTVSFDRPSATCDLSLVRGDFDLRELLVGEVEGHVNEDSSSVERSQSVLGTSKEGKRAGETSLRPVSSYPFASSFSTACLKSSWFTST
jgi:hypothetical protein